MRDNGAGNVIRNMRAWEAKKMAGLTGLGIKTASEAATHSKTFACWIDQTGDARRGLYGKWRPKDKVIEHGHRVDYGPHLELGFNGRYSILEPTINAIKNDWWNNVKRIMESKI